MQRPSLLLPALALLLGAAGASPAPLGLGIASVRVEPGVQFGLFADPTEADPVATVELVWDERTHSVTLGPGAPEWLRPETLSLDYALLTFRVLAVEEEGFEVVVDTETGRTLWLCRELAIAFKPWAQYLVEDVTGFSRLDAQANPLRTSPNDTAAAIPYEGQQGWDCLAVAEVRGEWVRVRLSDLCAFGGAEPVDGWVRWRNGDVLLIGYGLAC